jgi:hypothetical protein
MRLKRLWCEARTDIADMLLLQRKEVFLSGWLRIIVIF